MHYLKYTNVHHDVTGIKRLQFIMHAINKRFHRANILDIGCGTGSVTIPLGCSEHKIDGIDIDSKSIEIAKNRNNLDNVEFEVKDIKSVRKQYDVVLAIQVLEHLHNPLEMLKEIHRTTKKLAIITVPHGYGPSEIVGRVIGKVRGDTRLKSGTKTNEGMFTANYNNPHVQKFTVKKMRDLAEMAGFKLKEVHHHNFLLGTFPFNQLFFHTPWKRVFERIDSKVADKISPRMVSGYYFVLEK